MYKIYLDFWYGDKVIDVARISCSWSCADCVYRGNMWDASGRIIGDYMTTDSLQIERTFSHLRRV